jgi:hypothetical protein
MIKFIPQWHFRFARQTVETKPQLIDPKSEDTSLNSLEFGSQIGSDWNGKITKAEITDKSFQIDQPLDQQLLQATGLDPKKLKIDWNKPENAFEPKLPVLKSRRITDASGDSSLTEVFETAL